MPHLSKHNLEEKIEKDLENRVIAFLANTSVKSRRDIYKEIYTKTERMMIAKRLAMVYLIDKNIPTHSISKLIKVSPSTVARFEVRFERNQLSKTSEWVRDKTVTNKLLKLMQDFAAIPFEAKNKSLGQFIDEL